MKRYTDMQQHQDYVLDVIRVPGQAIKNSWGVDMLIIVCVKGIYCDFNEEQSRWEARKGSVVGFKSDVLRGGKNPAMRFASLSMEMEYIS